MISRHDYLPFGEEVMANVGGRTTTQGYQANDGVRNQFTGYERDVESGLDYAQARYFASKHGRFTSVDPLTASANMKNPQTFNRYSYALNSPYKFTDPLGLAAHPADCNLSGCDRTANSTFEQVNEGEEQEATAGERRNAGENARTVEIFDMISNGEDMDEWLSLPETVRNYRRNGGNEEESNEQSLNNVSPSPSPKDGEFDGVSFQSIWNSHRGTDYVVEPPNPSNGYDHQCAMRLFEALIKAGVDVSSFKGAKWHGYAIRAYELGDWLVKVLGEPIKLKGGVRANFKQFNADIAGNTGIILLRRFWGEGGGQGHIDAYNGTKIKGARPDNDYINQARELWFWKLP